MSGAQYPHSVQCWIARIVSCLAGPPRRVSRSLTPPKVLVPLSNEQEFACWQSAHSIRQTVQVDIASGSIIGKSARGGNHLESRSRTFRVIRSTTGSPPRRPWAQSVEPEVTTVPPLV